MATYLHPGVYVEEIPSGSKPIEGVATSVAAFIGYTTKGPLGTPVRITKFDTYDDQFGGVRQMPVDATKGDPMGHAVSAFFQNGGTTAYIVRITQNFAADEDRADDKDAVRAQGFMDHPSLANVTQALRFTAVNEGTWANGILVKLADVQVAEGAEQVYDVQIGRNNKQGKFVAKETFKNVSLTSTSPQFIVFVINGFSELVEVALVPLGEVEVTQAGQMLGTSTSGNLTGVSLDFTGIADADDRTLTMKLDGATRSFEIPAENFADLSGLAERIQELVRGDSPMVARKEFTAVAEDNRLILTSGTRLPTSAIVVQNEGIAPTLKLGVDNGGDEKTGAQTAEAVWASPEESAQAEAMLSGGVNGSEPAADDYKKVFSDFVNYRDINIILVPGQTWSSAGNEVISAAIGHAEFMKSRMVIVDPPSSTALTTPLGVNQLVLPTSTYTVLYYPWVRVANPAYHPERNPGANETLLVQPSAFAAGMWSKIDGRRGVWKAPAGTETGLLGVADLEYKVEDGEQDVLNPLGVNAFRARPGFGTVIWGTRTLSTNADPEWRYVPVRRTAIMIEQSIYNGIQWAVFEPNDHRLWSALRANIGGFMDGLFRSGAFQGEKASDAYFVRCRLGDTMTQDDIDAGRVIVIIGFAPLKPAEFVIVRIQQKVGQQ